MRRECVLATLSEIKLILTSDFASSRAQQRKQKVVTIRDLISEGRSAREWRVRGGAREVCGLALESAAATLAFPPSVPLPPSAE